MPREEELIELQMTIRIEGGSIRFKGRRPLEMELSSPCFSSSPDEWKRGQKESVAFIAR